MIKMWLYVVFTSLQPIVDVHMMDDALTPGVRQEGLHRNDSQD